MKHVRPSSPTAARRTPKGAGDDHHGVSLSRLALLIGSLLSAHSASHANPTGGNVVAGSATLSNPVAGTLDVRQSTDRAIIHWQGFGIGVGETVNFIQPSSRSVTLNRVVGNDPSAIFGRLNANGTVMLVNPNGVVFGPTSRVDVGGLVATTANIRDQDFLAGRYAFDQASPLPNASVVNQGEITIRDSGLAALVAPQVRNSGVIQARLGRVALGGANTFTLDFQGDGLLSFSAGSAVGGNGQAGPLVSHTGEIHAEGGTVLLTARAVKDVIDNVINTDGLVSATSVGEREGRIVLSGGDAGRVAVGGTLDASGRAAGETGGRVIATGEHVDVAAGARIDTSGHAGGGEIALGSLGLGDGNGSGGGERYAGKSRSVDVAAGASLRADALERGRGGDVSLWSTEVTRFGGSLSARGGAAGGNGGFAEVSSLKDIGLAGSVDLRAPQGRTGELLLDPTSLRITDTPSGGSQSGNAGDGSIGASDADQGAGATLNTVSRGTLEALSGSTNITLQATGQITIDAMAGGLINLATTAGHSFKLQSTQSGGIRFVDAATEIGTQGGSITLEALGIGSTLANTGRLTSRGGAITLTATGDIQLGGAIDAGAGTVTAQSFVGSIGNVAAGSAPRLTGSAVQLAAAGGSVGAAGNAILTHTANLSLDSGGSLVASNDLALSDLTLVSAHVLPGSANTYQVSAPGLVFSAADGASAYAVSSIAQATGLNLAFTGDRSLALGNIDVGAGSLALSSSAGNLTGTAGNLLKAGSVSLTAKGATGNNGAIGTGTDAVNTATASLRAISGSGGAFVDNTGALALQQLENTGASRIGATGHLTAGAVTVGGALTLSSSGGNLLDDGSAATTVRAGSLSLQAGGSIGTAVAPLTYTATQLDANAAVGGVYAGASGAVTLNNVVSGNGAIALTTGGATTVNTLESSTSGAANGISLDVATGQLTVGRVSAGTQGNVALTTHGGNIISSGAQAITGDTVTLSSVGTGSSFETISVRTAANHLNVNNGQGSVSVQQTGAVTLDNLRTTGNSLSVTSASGDVTLGSLSTGTSGTATVTASAGAIVDDANTATRITANTVNLSSSGSIGTSAAHVNTSAASLSLTSTGNLYLDNVAKTLTTLTIDNRHAAPGAVNTLLLSSPYLSFDITDDGSRYALDKVIGTQLSSFSFTGDRTLRAGQLQSSSAISLRATQGDLVDDGNDQTRVTAPTVTLRADQGSLGTSTNAMALNATGVSLTTRGDLYVADIADLNSLTISSLHADTTGSHAMVVTAPSLRFDVVDSTAGHHVRTLGDLTSLSLSFTSDRNITLGAVDVSYSGSARFNASTGSVLDDGDKATRVLANSVDLQAGQAIGATGTGFLDVVTGSLNANASQGGVYVTLPMATGVSNFTNGVSLQYLSSNNGPIVVKALQGDLLVDGYVQTNNGALTLEATTGSILNPNYGYLDVGTGAVQLTAAHAIGTLDNRIQLSVLDGATLTAQAGTSMYFGAYGGHLTLSSLSAASGIGHEQYDGNVTVGSVGLSGAGDVTLYAYDGSLFDDGNTASGVTGSTVALRAAYGSVGATGAALSVASPSLAISAAGNVHVDDSLVLTRLELDRSTAGSPGTVALTSAGGQVFTLTEDGNAHRLQTVTSASPLAFSFSGNRNVEVGSIDVGATGSATLSSLASLVDDGVAGTKVSAGTVGLKAGGSGSVGATGAGNAIALEGTSVLSVEAGRNVYAGTDTALTGLSATSTNATTAVGTASVFAITAPGQTFGITDAGTTQSLDVGGAGLSSFAFANRKNIQVAAIAASGNVSLSTSGGGANSNITSDTGSGRIVAGSVTLSATSSTAGGGNIGTTGKSLALSTPSVTVTGSGNILLNDDQALTTLGMTVSHGTNTTYSYGIGATNILSFGITDGNTQSLGMAVSGAMDFAYSVDRGLSLGTIDTGTSSSGSLALTSRSAPTGNNPSINRASGTLTGGRISLTAVGSNGSVGESATLSTNTQNLSIAAGGNVSVSNATTLQSLSLDARHTRSSGGSTNTYGISSTGLTLSISDTTSTPGFQLTNISQSGLDLSVKADRFISASTVNTGSGGKVSLTSSSSIAGNNANAITTGDLTLTGGSVSNISGGAPMSTVVNTLTTNLSGSLYLSNTGSLTLKNNTVAGGAEVVTSGSFIAGASSVFTTPSLTLRATQGSIGALGASLLTDTRQLTTDTGRHVYLNNASDLYALSMTSNHAAAGQQNTIALFASGLNLDLTDSVGGNQYHLNNLSDVSGVNYFLSTDVALSLGTADVQAGRSLSLRSTGGSITNDGGSQLTGNSVTLSASGSVGAAGGTGTRMQTNAQSLAVTTGANAFVDNSLDLASLSLTSTQANGGTAPVYGFTAPSLSFDVTDSGLTRVDSVVDTSGLTFSLSTVRSQSIGVIDTTRAGSVFLSSTGDILGDADASKRIVAASASITTTSGGSAGSVANPIHLSAPLTSFYVSGPLNVESDTHIDTLSLRSSHPTATYGGAYSILSVPHSGAQYALLSATDDATGTFLSNIVDTESLAFSFQGDRAIQVGSIDLGILGSVALSTTNGNIAGDGDTSTVVRAGSLGMSTSNGAIGTAGSGNGIGAIVNAMSSSTTTGGTVLALHGPTTLGGITANGAVSITNDIGDIALGSIDARGFGLSVDNQGGSILSGSLSRTATVSLTANGSIGNVSAISSSTSGGSTTLTASATAANGATGSVAFSESFSLIASSVTAAGDISLTGANSSGNLTVGTIASSGGAVSLTSGRGSILGSSGANSVTGSAVTLNATYGSSAAIGSSGTRLNIATTDLTLNNPGSFYITNSGDLSRLAVSRSTSTGTTSAGTLSLTGTNLAFNASDAGNTTTFAGLSDTTGLNFSYQGIGSIALGGAMNVTSTGSVLLRAAPSSGAGAITGSGLVTAGTATLQATGTASNLGTSGTALQLRTGSLTASAGTGGIWLAQDGTIDLASVTSAGALSVTAGSGDIRLTSVSYGNGQSLDLTASNGSILSGGGTLTGSVQGSTYGAINLTAANGIGTRLAPVLVSAANGSGTTGTAVSATVTGNGSLYLNSLSNLNNGLTTSVANGSTNVTSAGNIALTSLTSGTDTLGNDIDVTATGGNITVRDVVAGAVHGRISLSANAGSVIANTLGSNLSAYAIDVFGADGVGSSPARLGASGQRVEVTSNGGAVYLKSSSPSAFSRIDSGGGLVDIASTSSLLLANVASGGGNVTVAATGAGSDLIAGNVNAGGGQVSLTSAAGAILDDGNTLSRVAGARVSLTGANGVGTTGTAVQTTTAELALVRAGAGSSIHVDDNNSAGTAVTSALADDGSIRLATAGETLLASVVSTVDSASNDITVTSGGRLTVGVVNAKTLGDVSLTGDSIVSASSGSPRVTAAGLSLSAVNGIGSVTDAATGAGSPLLVNAGNIALLSSTAAGSVVSIDNSNTAALTLGGALTVGTGGSIYVKTAGDLDASGSLATPQANLLLQSGGVLTLPSTQVDASGTVTLSGTTDVVAAGADPRNLKVAGSSLTLRSGAAGGATTLTTAVGGIDASLTGTGALTVNNTGLLASAILATSNGNVTATSSTGMTSSAVTAGGAGRTIDLSVAHGDLSTGTLNAGVAGTVRLSAADGTLLSSGGTVTASTLDLTSGSGIGSTGAAYTTSATNVSAQVIGTGDIVLATTGPLTLGQVSTHDGSIAVTSGGNLQSATGISAGNSGNIALTSTGGNVSVTHAITHNGSDTAKSGVSVSGSQVSVAAVTTSGAQQYTGGTTLNGDLAGRSITVTGNTTLAGGDRLLDTRGGNGNITLGTLAGGAHGANLQAGTGAVSLGGNASGLASLTIGAGSIALASVTSTGAQAYTGTTALNGNYATTNADFTVTGNATMAGAVTVGTGTGNVRFGGSLLGLSHALAVDSAGVTRFDGVVTAASVATDAAGSVALNGGAVVTTGNQTYNDAVVLGANTSLTANAVTFNGRIDAQTAGAQSLAMSGDVNFGNTIGGLQPLGALSVAGNTVLSASTASVGATISTAGGQHYAGNVTLGNDQELSNSGSGAIVFGGTIDGARALGIGQTGGGDITLSGNVGQTTRLAGLSAGTTGAIRIDGSVRSGWFSSNTLGSFVFNGGSIDTTQAQTHWGHIVLGADTVFTSSTGVVSLMAGADAVTPGGQSLSILGESALTGAFGAAQSLGSLSVGGRTTLGPGSITSIGDQAFQGAVTLTGNQLIQSGSGNVSFDGTVNGGYGLAVIGTSGDVRFSQALGNTARLNGLLVNTAGTTRFDGAVQAVSVTTGVAGRLLMNGGSVDTLGTQSYGQRVELAADTSLSGSTVSLLSGADAATSGQQSLAISGNAVLKGQVGAVQALGSLSVSGATTLGPGAIATTGNQTFNGAVTLAGEQILNSGGNVAFGGTLDGAQALTITSSGAGNVGFAQAVGGSERLGTLAVTTAGATSFGGGVRAVSVTTDAPGTLALNGGSVDTVGAQNYGERAVLGADTVLTGSSVVLANGADGSSAGGQSLAITGDAALTGDFGANQALKSLSVGGSTALGAGSVTTTGSQTYTGAVALGGAQSLHSTAGDIAFGSSLDSASHANLSLAADGGAIRASGAIGNTQALGALTLLAGTDIVLVGDVVVDRLVQTGAGGATRFGGKLKATGTGGLQLAGHDIAFEDEVTAELGALAIANASATDTVRFAGKAGVQAATGFTQTGGASVVLPAKVKVTLGDIVLEAPARLPSGLASIVTDGDVRLSGLWGPATAVTIDSGLLGAQVIGVRGGDAGHQIVVANLAVPYAGSASMYGVIGGQGGAPAASRINSTLYNAPYFINDTPWAPADLINRLAATTVPSIVVPSTPGLDALFRHEATRLATSPDVLSAFGSPQVLTFAPSRSLSLQLPDPAENERRRSSPPAPAQ
jgi:filamentous hemagglutinin family protein